MAVWAVLSLAVLLPAVLLLCESALSYSASAASGLFSSLSWLAASITYSILFARFIERVLSADRHEAVSAMLISDRFAKEEKGGIWDE